MSGLFDEDPSTALALACGCALQRMGKARHWRATKLCAVHELEFVTHLGSLSYPAIGEVVLGPDVVVDMPGIGRVRPGRFISDPEDFTLVEQGSGEPS